MAWAGRLGASAAVLSAIEADEQRRIREELQRHLQSLVGEQKQDLHRERFPLTPEGLFDQIWEAVLVRDDLEQSLQDWRAMRLEAVAQDAQAAAADGDDVDAEAEDASHELQSSEQPQPDNFVRPLTRLPKGHLVALAHAEEVLLDRTLAQLDAHYDECFMRFEQERIRTEAAAEGAEPEPGTLLPRRRRNAYRVDPRVLEARLSKRYEEFSLPESVRTLFQQPAHEKDWERLEQLASIIQGAARGIRDVSEETVAAASQEQA